MVQNNAEVAARGIFLREPQLLYQKTTVKTTACYGNLKVLVTLHLIYVLINLVKD